jgi:hyperosmotically inducible protein
MKTLRFLSSCALLLAVSLPYAGCSMQDHKSPDVTSAIRSSLEQANLNDVSVSQDRDKGVVTLTGTVAGDADKAQAESIAKSIAGSQVVSNQIAVRPPGAESTAKTIDSDLDKAIDHNVDAELVKHKLNHDVKYSVKNGVVILSGKVNSQSLRSTVEKWVAAVPNVQQVVNEIDVKDQKATTTH